MDDVTAVQWARGTVRAEMTRRGMTYADLTRNLQSLGLDENERNLRNKIARGTFSAAFFFQCMRAIGVTDLVLDALDVAPILMSKEERRRAIAAFPPEERAETEEMFDEIQKVLDAGEMARRGE